MIRKTAKIPAILAAAAVCLAMMITADPGRLSVRAEDTVADTTSVDTVTTETASADTATPETDVTGAIEPDDNGSFDADAYYERLLVSVESIRERTDFVPQIAVVLGSGLGNFVKDPELEIDTVIPYKEIEEFPTTSVAGHEGKLIFASYGGKDLVIMQGRVHYYEGYDIHDVVFPVRVMHLLGADTLILTNAVGAINEDYSVGDFVVVRDHISDFVPSPLSGENVSQLGTRFVSMTNAYDQELQELALQIGEEEGLGIHSGIYLQVPGPQYETPAEIRMFRMFGADTVGMSSAVETIAARHMGMRVIDINCVTNMAAGIGESDFSHHDVVHASHELEQNYTVLLKRLIAEMKQQGGN